MTIDEKPKEAVLELVKKMLNMTTENGCSEAEATVAAEKAQKMLFDYNLTMVDVEDYDLPDKGANRIEKNFVHLPDQKWGQPIDWKIQLAFQIAEYNFCKGLTAGHSVTFIGRKVDAEFCKELFFWITDQAQRLADESTEQYRVKSHRLTELKDRRSRLTIMEAAELADLSQESLYTHPLRWKNNFLHGLVDRVGSRLAARWYEMRKSTAQSTALVLVTETAIKEYMDEKYPKIKSYHEPENVGGGGYREGHQAGGTIKLTPVKTLQAK